MSDENRESLQAQVGYLTAQLDNMKEQMRELSAFVKEHMNKEEVKFATIDQRFEKGYRWMIVLSFIIVSDSAGLPLEKLLKFVFQFV